MARRSRLGNLVQARRGSADNRNDIGRVTSFPSTPLHLKAIIRSPVGGRKVTTDWANEKITRVFANRLDLPTSCKLLIFECQLRLKAL